MKFRCPYRGDAEWMEPLWIVKAPAGGWYLWHTRTASSPFATFDAAKNAAERSGFDVSDCHEPPT